LRTLVVAALALALLWAVFHRSLIRKVGGASSQEPEAMAEGLSPESKALVARALEGIEPGQLFDYHTHIVGMGTGDSGCFVNSHMLSWRHPVQRLKFLIYASACGIDDVRSADEQFLTRLLSLVRSVEGHGRNLALAFDKHYGSDGQPVLDKTEFYVPNDYVVKLARSNPDAFVPAISVHPYRSDALGELDKWAAQGVRFVKWLPNAMGIDPANPRCVPFYQRMKEHGMVLLSHAGEEKAVAAEEAQKLGNPLRLRLPLGLGLKVILAHGASLGTGEDLDDPGAERVDNFDLFLRLMEDDRFDEVLFADISATLQYNRLDKPIRTLLERTDLHSRLVNGSDYPLPAINIIVRTGALLDAGLITSDERDLLNEIYDYNPLLFDLVAKRTVRLPGAESGFPASMFTVHPKLPVDPPKPESS
jgi:predicted TIM-barrel fold metal-dependent hydrolase